ncbi:MAG: glycoside hydrolase family 30 beta sandwich domain-containing protein [Armatimonadota bacterium]|nr:glycoside hydrolase family 30 beta sandwich domain-containing protein [Armatimonadota bacterium]
MRWLAILLLAVLVVSPVWAVEVTVRTDQPGQKWEGWGTSDLFSLDALQVEPEANNPGLIPVEARKQILKLYYRDLGMTRVRMCPMGYEPENDNNDPRVLNPAGFVWEGRGTRPVNSINPFCEDHLVMGGKFRSRKEPFTLYPATHQWEKFLTIKPDSPTWFWGPDARFNTAMVDEYAEHALAAVLHVKDVYRYEIPYWSPFNEPSNTAKIGKETTLALVLACGRRFAENKLNTRLAICDDVTPEASAETVEYVLANEEARKYVGAVSYHRYCGDFVLERVKPMLAKVGEGKLLVSEPVSFYKSAVKYGKSVWLSEQCSYGDQGITYLDAGRARANHICDEINYGEVNVFDFMLPYFIERGRPGNEETPIFLRFKDGKFASAEINPFGSWISHFTRYIRPGSVQLKAEVPDPLVKAVAFKHKRDKTLTVVVVNNHAEPVDVTIAVEGKLSSVGGEVRRIRTSPTETREKLSHLRAVAGAVTDSLPGLSVTTYVATPKAEGFVGL